MPNNLIRVKQLDQNELSGFVGQSIASTGLLNDSFVTKAGDQTISGNKTFKNNFLLFGDQTSSAGSIHGNTSNGGEVSNLYIVGVGGAGVNESNLTISSEYDALSLGRSHGFGFGNTYFQIDGGGENLIISNTNVYVYENIYGSKNVYANNLVYNTGNQIISGIKTFANAISGNFQVSGTGIFNALDLNNIDTLSLSGVDITITSGAVTLTNPISAPNLVYNIGNQTISGVKTFISSGIFSLSGAAPIGLPNNPLSIVGSGNTYLQLNVQNRASGTNATADLVITANNGNDSSNFINLGINNFGYNDVGFTNGTGYDGYLFINGGNLDIATQTPNKYIEFQIGGTTQNRTIARIDNSGINVVSGTYRLNDIPYNTSTITFISSNANLTVGQNYISNVGAGYSATVTERLMPIMDTCTARKASISLLNSGPGNSIAGITGLFINTSSVPNQTGIINSAISAYVGQNQYTFTGAFATPININAGDNVVCSLNSNNTATNVRTAATIYLYN
jgi:hypothetical protein